jgi:hypothetical protein
VTVTLSVDGPKLGFGRSGRLSRGLKALVNGVKRGVAAAIRPHSASLKRLTEMPLTVIGTSGIDFAAFHIAHGWGWLATGVSLLIVEQMISDPE